MLRCSGSSQNPGSSVLDELKLSNGLLVKETITIIHPAGDKGMTTKTKVCLQNHPKIFDLIFSCLTTRVKLCIHLENFIFVSKCNNFSFLLV